MASDSDTYRDVLIALHQIVKATSARSKRIARETGLSTPQLLALQIVDTAQTLTAGELARELNLTQATVTALVTRLEDKQLLARRKDDSDRRRVNISVTAAGRALLGEAPRALQDALAARFGQLESWEQLQVLSVVQRLAILMDTRDMETAPVLDIGTLAEHEST